MPGFKSMRCALAAVLALAAATLAAPVAAQDQAAGVARPGFSFDPFARVETGVVLSESSDQDEDLVVNGDGGYLRLQAGTEFGTENTVARIEADRIFVERFGSATGRGSYDRDRLTASLTQKIGSDVEIELRGRLYDDLVSIESADTDELQGAAIVTWEPVQAHRFRLGGTWREREYDDGMGPGGSSSEGQGPRVDAEYRHRLGRYHYINFDLRAEEITSDNPERGYNRESAAIAYTRPITDDLRVRPAIEWRRTAFDGRLTPTGELREDEAIVPEVELLWWTGNWRVEAEAKYLFTDSNDPLRDREGYRFAVSVGYVF